MNQSAFLNFLIYFDMISFLPTFLLMNTTRPTTLTAKISKNNQLYPESAIISAEKGEASSEE